MLYVLGHVKFYNFKWKVTYQIFSKAATPCDQDSTIQKLIPLCSTHC